jgi:tyrosyl-tRNA synthetase
MPAASDLELLAAGAVNVVTEAELAARLASGKPLRVKLGIDPTASDIHLGFAVVLRKLRQFQDLGHTAVLILGDFTAQVGDPSGRSATRPRVSKEEVDAHATTYLDQIRLVLDDERLEVRRNSEWLAPMGIEDVLRLAARTTVARMLERDDFAKRYAGGAPISVMEFLYPLLQAWDSVMVHADVELGGTDQLWNLLLGRQVQEQEGQAPQVALTTPLLVGLDGVQKMSKSLGNYVGITEPPTDQFGKLMSIPDELMPSYFEHATNASSADVVAYTEALERGERRPVDAKRELARRVVDLYHGDGAGAAAEEEFDRVFRAHDAPSEIPEHVLDASDARDGVIRIAAVLRQAGLAASNKEGARLIAQGGVRLDGEVVADADAALAPAALDGRTLQAGRRRWVRIKVAGAPR